MLESSIYHLLSWTVECNELQNPHHKHAHMDAKQQHKRLFWGREGEAVSYEPLWQSARQDAAAADQITRHMWLADTFKPYQSHSNHVLHVTAQLHNQSSVYSETTDKGYEHKGLMVLACELITLFKIEAAKWFTGRRKREETTCMKPREMQGRKANGF